MHLAFEWSKRTALRAKLFFSSFRSIGKTPHKSARSIKKGAMNQCCRQSRKTSLPLSSRGYMLSQRIANACSLIQKLSASNRSEEHTSELQSRFDLVCRLLLEKKK